MFSCKYFAANIGIEFRNKKKKNTFSFKKAIKKRGDMRPAFIFNANTNTIYSATTTRCTVLLPLLS